MEESVLIEKVISVYILVLSFVDLYVIAKQVVWPISFFLVSSFLPDGDALSVGLWAGGLLFVHTLAKIAGFLIFPALSKTCSLKLVLLLQLSLTSASAMLLGIFPSFTCIFISRTLSGLSSSLQPVIRRVFLAMCLKEKTDWPVFASKLLWTSKLAGFGGVLISGLLSNPSLVLAKAIDKSAERWFLLGLILFLLNISALLLVFSIDSQNLSEFGKLSFRQLEEKGEKEEERPENDEKNQGLDSTALEKTDDRPTFNFRRFFDEREEKKEIPVKFYSPKHDANKSSCFHVPLSARVENKTRTSAETVDGSTFSPDVKKTHISIIEDDLPDFSQVDSESKLPEVQVADVKELTPRLSYALFYRGLLTFYASLLYESLPFLLIASDDSISIGCVSMFVGLPFVFAASVKNWFSPYIISRVSCTKLSSWCIGISSFLLIIQTILMTLQPSIWYLPFTSFLLFSLCEMILPLGVILVCDSVKESERDSALFRSDIQCFLWKLFSGLISSLLIFGVHPGCLTSFLLVLSLLLVPVHSKTSRRYRLAAQFPYAL